MGCLKIIECTCDLGTTTTYINNFFLLSLGISISACYRNGNYIKSLHIKDSYHIRYIKV